MGGSRVGREGERGLRVQVKSRFRARNLSVDVKCIDPTYMIRARPPNSADHILCTVLGQNAV